MAQKVNITIDQGSTFSTTCTINDSNGSPIDLSVYTGAAQMRKAYSSSNSTSFTVSANSIGIILMSMSANTTGNLTAGRYVYDIELTSTANGNVTRMIEGIVTVTPQVTK
jgi:hypothetical protein